MEITPYVQYESIDTWHLYQEFRSIPGNKMVSKCGMGQQ